MAINFQIIYQSEVVKIDIPAIPKKLKETIKTAIEERLTFEPEKFGKPLRKSLAGYRKLRVGNFRIIFRIDKNQVKIFAIQNRKVVYQNIQNRI